MGVTDADAVLVHIEELDKAFDQGVASRARDTLADAAATIRGLQAELARVNKANDLLCDVNAALRGDATAGDPLPGGPLLIPCDPREPRLFITDGSHASLVIAWLRMHINSRPGKYELVEQLKLAMHAAGLSYSTWYNAEPVLQAGLRLEEREIWKGHTTKVYVMDDPAERGA